MHATARRTGAIATLAAASFFGATSAAGAFPSYRHCDLYNRGGDHLIAYCTAKAAGTEYRVVIRCQNGRTYYGAWRRQGGTYSSSRFCPKGVNLRTGDRQLR
jgi:hypothetical protein